MYNRSSCFFGKWEWQGTYFRYELFCPEVTRKFFPASHLSENHFWSRISGRIRLDPVRPPGYVRSGWTSNLLRHDLLFKVGSEIGFLKWMSSTVWLYFVVFLRIRTKHNWQYFCPGILRKKLFLILRLFMLHDKMKTKSTFFEKKLINNTVTKAETVQVETVWNVKFVKSYRCFETRNCDKKQTVFAVFFVCVFVNVNVAACCLLSHIRTTNKWRSGEGINEFVFNWSHLTLDLLASLAERLPSSSGKFREPVEWAKIRLRQRQ